jgi:hypothetical protein
VLTVDETRLGADEVGDHRMYEAVPAVERGWRAPQSATVRNALTLQTWVASAIAGSGHRRRELPEFEVMVMINDGLATFYTPEDSQTLRMLRSPHGIF